MTQLDEWRQKIMALGYQGVLIECTKEEYETGLRTSLQAQAARWIDEKQTIRAMIALEEVKRLDEKFDQP